MQTVAQLIAALRQHPPEAHVVLSWGDVCYVDIAVETIPKYPPPSATASLSSGDSLVAVRPSSELDSLVVPYDVIQAGWRPT